MARPAVSPSGEMMRRGYAKRGVGADSGSEEGELKRCSVAARDASVASTIASGACSAAAARMRVRIAETSSKPARRIVGVDILKAAKLLG